METSPDGTAGRTPSLGEGSGEGFGPQPVDLEGFRAAMREVGVEHIVEPTLQVFAVEAAAIFKSLAHAMVSGDLETVNTAGHTLKSASANVRAFAFADALGRLEAAAGNGDPEEARRAFARCRTEYDAVTAFLSEAGFFVAPSG